MKFLVNQKKKKKTEQNKTSDARQALLKTLKVFSAPKAIFEIQCLKSGGEVSNFKTKVSHRIKILLLTVYVQNKRKLNLFW